MCIFIAVRSMSPSQRRKELNDISTTRSGCFEETTISGRSSYCSSVLNDLNLVASVDGISVASRGAIGMR